MNALTRSIATDYAKDGIRCNTLAPGYVVSEGREELSGDRLATFEAMHLTRISVAEDIAAAAEFLARSGAEVITGVLLPVDSGSSAAVRSITFGSPRSDRARRNASAHSSSLNMEKRVRPVPAYAPLCTSLARFIYLGFG